MAHLQKLALFVLKFIFASICIVHANTFDPFVSQIQNSPASTFKAIRTIARTARSEGKKTFLVPRIMYESFLDQAKAVAEKELFMNLDESLYQRKISLAQRDEFKFRYDEILAELQNLKSEGIPYHHYIQWGFKFIHINDDLTRIRDPKYKSRYHEKLAKHIIPRLMERWSDMFMYFTFQDVDEEFFLDTRPVPAGLLGVSADPRFGDGYDLSQAEWTYHDGGHIEFMELLDFMLRENQDLDRDDQIDLFEFNKQRIKAKRLELLERDPALFRAVTQLLFEIIHERGFQYYFPMLLPQLDTDKWVEVLKRKLENNFWINPPIQKEDIPRLSEARRWLQKIVKGFVNEDIKTAFKDTESGKVSEWTIEILPDTKLFHGSIEYIELRSTHEISIVTDVQELDREAAIPLFNLSLAQQPPLSDSPMTPGNTEIISVLLSAKNSGNKKWLINNEVMFGELHSLTISGEEISAKFVVDGVGRPVFHAISNIDISGFNHFDPTELDPVAIFKINQALKIQKDKKTAEFSHSNPVERLRGKPLEIKNINGVDLLHFQVISDPPRSELFPISRLFVKAVKHTTKNFSGGDFSSDALVEKFEKDLSSISYNDWKFYVGRLERGEIYMRPHFAAYDSADQLVSAQHGRYWLLTSEMTGHEVRQTALLAAFASAEHQARRNFIFLGKRIYGHQFSLDKLIELSTLAVPETGRERSLLEMQKLVQETNFPEAEFHIGIMTKDNLEGFYVQVSYKNPHAQLENLNSKSVYGKEFFIPKIATDSVILHSFLKALLDAARQEVLENFLVDKKSIYSENFHCASSLISLQK